MSAVGITRMRGVLVKYAVAIEGATQLWEGSVTVPRAGIGERPEWEEATERKRALGAFILQTFGRRASWRGVRGSVFEGRVYLRSRLADTDEDAEDIAGLVVVRYARVEVARSVHGAAGRRE